MVIRVAANIDQLRKNLTEGKIQIEALSAGMEKYARSFDGSKIIQQANNITAAVDKIGGASKLTAAEQDRVNAVVTKALEKYAALGKEAPPAMVALAEATKRVEEPTEQVSTKMIALGVFVGEMAAKAVSALGRLAMDGLRFVRDGIVDILTTGSQLNQVQRGFGLLAESVNTTAQAMLGAMRTGTRGLVADMDLMSAANKAVLLGLPVTASEMGDLARTATVLGGAMGLGPTQAFDNLITALGRSSPLILDNLGLTVKVGEANEAYAAQLGKAASELDAAEQKTAFYNAAMTAARKRVEDLGEAHLGVGDRIQQALVWWQNFNKDLSIAVANSPVFNEILTRIAGALESAFGDQRSEQLRTATHLLEQAAIATVGAVDLGVQGAGLLARAWAAVELVYAGTASAVDFVYLALVRLGQKMYELGSLIPGFSDHFKALAAEQKLVGDSIAYAQAQFHAQAEAALEAIEGTSKFQESIGDLHGFLASLHDQLQNVAAAEVQTKATTDALASSVGALAAVDAPAATQAVTETAMAVERAAEQQKIWDSGLHLTAETIATEMVPAVEQLNSSLAKANQQTAQAFKTTISALSPDQIAASGGLDALRAELAALEALYALNPGRAPNGTGKTGLASSDFDGYLRMLEEQQRYLALKATLGSLPGFANGVANFGGGMAIVGERGPEIVNLPRGSSVLPTGAGVGSLTVQVVFNNPLMNDPRSMNHIADLVGRALEDRLSTTARMGIA